MKTDGRLAQGCHDLPQDGNRTFYCP